MQASGPGWLCCPVGSLNSGEGAGKQDNLEIMKEWLSDASRT
jgi:hypothetical protein